MNKLNLAGLIFGFCLLVVLSNSCKKTPIEPINPNPPDPIDTTNVLPDGTTYIEPSAQRGGGDATVGWNYLIYGDYVSSGIPAGIFNTVYGLTGNNLLNRTGDNANVPYDYNAILHKNGAKIVSPNCFQCHAHTIDGQFIPGLGNSMADFTNDQSAPIPVLDNLINFVHGANSDEWNAYKQFRDGVVATGPHIVEETVGANTADMVAAVLAAHRKGDDMTWSSIPFLPIPPSSELAPTDVPAWWLLKKKHAMFYAGIGRGDYAKFLMATSLLTMKDTSEAVVTDKKFIDVLAYIESIEPPVYSGSINTSLLERGKEVFELNCSKCHGTYGDQETYPNLLVDVDEVGTDPAIVTANFSQAQFVNWFNDSWFGTSENPAVIKNDNGYIAPPLDGVWATAPYLHNGSVPTLHDLLDSSQRPEYWRRTMNTDDYDHAKMGWQYTTETSKVDKNTYDTNSFGYSNAGHTYGDALNASDREALIEYLKTI